MFGSYSVVRYDDAKLRKNERKAKFLHTFLILSEVFRRNKFGASHLSYFVRGVQTKQVRSFTPFLLLEYIIEQAMNDDTKSYANKSLHTQ